MKFKISPKEGLNYSKISGDNNKIHIDDLYGYNSIFGEKICHGCLVILKFFKTFKIYKFLKNKKIYSIKVHFFKYFKYNKNIDIKKKLNTFRLFQEGKIIAEIEINLNNNFSFLNYKGKEFSFKFKKKTKNIKITEILNTISRYVGTINPGLNSIINQININYNYKYELEKSKIKIFSRKKDKRAPIILNKLHYGKFLVYFIASERPVLKKRKIKPKKFLLKKIKQIKKNILILGASQGIGASLLDILSYNKHVKIIASYNRNKINLSKTNIKKIKININKDYRKILYVIKKYTPIRIYYFISPKILLDKKLGKKNKSLYKKLFIDFPLKIIKENKTKNISFFYPSTIYINNEKNLDYSKIKKKAEFFLYKCSEKNKIPLTILRLPVIKSRQTLSFLNKNQQDFIDFLNKDKVASEKLLSQC